MADVQEPRANVETEAERGARSLHLSSFLLAQAGFTHGFSLRSADGNMHALGEALGFDPARAYQAEQVHGASVLTAEGDPAELRQKKGDAVLARQRGVGAAIRVADCVPLLVADGRTGAVAAIHAGWRGLVAGVIGAALDALARRGARDALFAAIGPHIGPCCFEVGADVAALVAGASHEGVVTKRVGEKAYVDLRRAAREHLLRAGVHEARIDDVEGCTRCDASRFFSYRRDGARAGRHVAVIVARGQSQ